MIRRVAAALAGIALAAAVHPLRAASDLSGKVVFTGLAVPGAAIEAAQGDRTRSTTSNADGIFHFAALDDGVWTLRVTMRGFVPMTRVVTIPSDAAPLVCELTMQSFEQMMANAPRTAPAVPPAEPALTDTDIEFISGSVSNGAATPFAQPPAFGNNRLQQRSRYSGGLTLLLGNSAWNARPFSFTGAGTAPRYGDVQIGGVLIGPLRIPGLVRRGPQLMLAYQHGELHTATSQSALLPTDAERRGDLSASLLPIIDPRSGEVFAGNVIPADRISSQAAALLAYYPRPDAPARRGSNFEQAIVASTSTDTVQASITRNLGTRATAAGAVAFQRSASDTTGLFDFTDRSRQSTLEVNLNWSRRITTRLSVRGRYQFGRTASSVVPFFAGRVNVSGDAGIAGNDQRPENWGPPALSFPDRAGLRDADYQRSVTMKHGGGVELILRRGRHNITAGGGARWNAYAISSQPDPRGTLAFTGSMTGHSFADFLLGLPSTSTIGFGPSPVRLSGIAYDAYATDDWRLGQVTLTLGARYEYEPPLAKSLRADRSGLEPRLAASWRPIAGSTLILRTGYGIYRNLGTYQPLAQLLAFQPPFARTLSVQSTPSSPLTLSDPFPASRPSLPTFVVDRGFRTGVAHNWHVSAQRDMPGSLTVIASYLAAKGSRLMQASLPNTYPAGGTSSCTACPSGFVLVTSGGSSLRNAAQLTVRRRLHDGLTASAQYTLASATDDAATFSNAIVSPHALSIAQDWRDPEAERGPSTFDQRHAFALQVQYTSGGGEKTTLAPRFVTRLLRDWTVAGELKTGSGLPFTPIVLAPIGGSGFAGIRPRLTGISPEPLEPGVYANPAAYAPPAAGTWGEAGRNSLRGPGQFSLDATVSRAFPLRGNRTLEAKLTAANVLNRVTFAAIDTSVTSPRFGVPTAANPMRRLQATLRYRF